MPTLFVLLPSADSAEALLALAANAPTTPTAPTARRYPPADDGRHLRSLLRSGRDPAAVTWWRGTLLAIGGGSLLGAATNGVLAGGFGMLGGLLTIAVPLGAVLGAFLGGFTAAMTGTGVPRSELRPLLAHVPAGSVLLQWRSPQRDAFTTLLARLGTAPWPHVWIGD